MCKKVAYKEKTSLQRIIETPKMNQKFLMVRFADFKTDLIIIFLHLSFGSLRSTLLFFELY